MRGFGLRRRADKQALDAYDRVAKDAPANGEEWEEIRIVFPREAAKGIERALLQLSFGFVANDAFVANESDDEADRECAATEAKPIDPVARLVVAAYKAVNAEDVAFEPEPENDSTAKSPCAWTWDGAAPAIRCGPVT